MAGAQRTYLRHLHVLAIVAASVLPSTASGAGVPVVSGSADAVTVEANEARLEQVLAAIGAKLRFGFRTSVPLELPVTGTYSGPLQRVLPRLLAGYNFVVRTTEEQVEVAIYGRSGPLSKAIEIAAPREPAAETPGDETPGADAEGVGETTIEGTPVALGTPEAVTERLAKAAVARLKSTQ